MMNRWTGGGIVAAKDHGSPAPFAEGETERGTPWRAVQYQEIVHVQAYFGRYNHWATAWTGHEDKYSKELAERVADEKNGKL